MYTVDLSIPPLSLFNKHVLPVPANELFMSTHICCHHILIYNDDDSSNNNNNNNSNNNNNNIIVYQLSASKLLTIHLQKFV